MRNRVLFVAALVLASTVFVAPAAWAHSVTGTISVGDAPVGVAFSPDGSAAYVTNVESNSVSVIDTTTGTVDSSIDLGTNSGCVAFGLDGSTAYVTNQTANTVSVIDTAAGTVTDAIAVGASPNGIAVSPDGGTAYVANFNSASVSVIDTSAGAVIDTIPVGDGPISIAFSPDGATAYVNSYTSEGGVTVIDTATRAVTNSIRLDGTAYWLAVSPDGATVYAAGSGNDGQGYVFVIDAAAGQVTKTVSVGRDPNSVAFSPDGSVAYVASSGSDTVSVIDTATVAVVKTLHVGSGPVAVAFSPGGATAYVANITSDTVSVISVDDHAPVFTSSAPPASATVGTPYSYRFAASGAPVPTYTVSSGSVPAGLSLSEDGLLSGTPTAAGPTTFSVTASNGVGDAAISSATTITVAANPDAPVFTSSTPQAGATVGKAYSFTFAASGNPMPTFRLVSGSVPDGLSLLSTGVLSGTPTAAGTRTFTVIATNGVDQDARASATITVAAAPAAPGFTASTPPAVATVGNAYSYTFEASGNPAPTFAVSSGAVPAGLELTSAGVLSGTPTAAGASTFTVTASNGVGTDATTGSLEVDVAAAPAAPVFTASTPPRAATVGDAYSYTFEASGNPAPTFAVSSGTPPAGLILTTAGVLSGTMTTAGSSTFTVTASNGVAQDVTAVVTIAVAVAAVPAPIVASVEAGNGALASTGISGVSGTVALGGALLAVGLVALRVTTRRKRRVRS